MRIRGIAAALIFLVSLSAHGGVLGQYPGLKKHLFRENESGVYLGFGVSPVSVLKNRVCFTANIFQAVWFNPNWDIEILTAGFGFSIGKDDYTASRQFSVRTSPKYRISEILSVGLLLGLEYVSFPSLDSRISKGGLFSPVEPFSSSGFTFGVAVSQTFHFGEDYLLKINEVVYQQNYSVDKTRDGWAYVFDEPEVQVDRTPIKPSIVFGLEVSLLY